MEDPARDASVARLFWRAETDPRVVVVDALAAAGDDLLDPHRLGVDCIHLVGPHAQHILWRAGARAIRLDVRSGTFLKGPVRLVFALGGMRDLGHQLMTLRRLVGLRRLKRFPARLFPPERRRGRWILMLRVLDARAAGASHREIAGGLYGEMRVGADWRSGSDYLRLRVQRLARNAARLRDCDYLEILRSPPPL